MNDSIPVQLPNQPHYQKQKGDPKPMSDNQPTSNLVYRRRSDGLLEPMPVSSQILDARRYIDPNPITNDQDSFADCLKLTAYSAIKRPWQAVKTTAIWGVAGMAVVFGVIPQLVMAVTGNYQSVAFNQIDPSNPTQAVSWITNKALGVATPVLETGTATLVDWSADQTGFEYTEVDQRQPAADDIRKELAEGAIQVNYEEP